MNDPKNCNLGLESPKNIWELITNGKRLQIGYDRLHGNACLSKAVINAEICSW